MVRKWPEQLIEIFQDYEILSENLMAPRYNIILSRRGKGKTYNRIHIHEVYFQVVKKPTDGNLCAGIFTRTTKSTKRPEFVDFLEGSEKSVHRRLPISLFNATKKVALDLVSKINSFEIKYYPLKT